MFYPNLSSYSFRFYFRIIILSNFSLNFWISRFSIFRKFTFLQSLISTRNQSQIHWFLIPWIRLQVLFHKISIFPISITDSLFDLIKFEEIIQNFPYSLWIRPLFTIIPLNSWIILKICKFGLYFYAWPRIFNDHSVSSRQGPKISMKMLSIISFMHSY